MLAGGGGVVQAGEQAGAVGACPCQRLAVVIQVRDRGQPAGAAGGGAGPGLAGQAGLGEGGGVLVVVQQPVQRLLASSAGSAAAWSRA